MAQTQNRIEAPEKRIHSFAEVSLGLPKKIALEEAKRCPQCADPVCIKGCPIGINIPGFIRKLREGDVNGAYETIKMENPLPSICGRICSAPCEVACILNEEKSPISIRALERFATDYGRSRTVKREGILRQGKRVAIIGSGPTGLTAAVQLTKKGFLVTVYEALDKPGGILRYGIPEFRIPRKILDAEIHDMKALGIEFETNFFIGQTLDLDELSKKGFVAALLATGAGIPKFMELPGANLGGVYYGEEFLMRVNLTKANIFAGRKVNFAVGNKVAVIGSGNTALDCARVARRFGREVTLIFRRTEEEMRVRDDEREYGKEEGVKFEPLVRPIEILDDGSHFVGGLKCLRMDYAQENENGKWKIEEVPHSAFTMEVDTVVIAVGHQPNSFINRVTLKLKLNEDATVWIDEKGMTSIPGVFAAGNVVTNAGPVVEAIASGKKAAEQITRYLK